MSDLLKEIEKIRKEASEVLSVAGFCTNSDIQSLTRQDLNELFPGPEKLRLRKEIFDIANKERANEPLPQEEPQLSPEESCRAPPSNIAVWNSEEYLRVLMDLKNRVNHVQNRLDYCISLLEGRPAGNTSTSSGPVALYQDEGASGSNGSGITFLPHKQPKDEPFTFLSLSEVAVFYRLVVSGQTFGAHNQLMDKVKNSVQNMILLAEGSQDSRITFVFCPISSRVASDVEAAMTDVKDDKPVILVLMHHSHEVKYTTSVRTWGEDGRVVLHVNVFYHETVRGLLRCEENNGAVFDIRSELLKRFCPISYNTSGNGLDGVTKGDPKKKPWYHISGWPGY